MPIEPGDSWFSPKCIEVQPRAVAPAGRALDGVGWRKPTDINQTANGGAPSPGVRLWGISSIVERGTAQTAS